MPRWSCDSKTTTEPVINLRNFWFTVSGLLVVQVLYGYIWFYHIYCVYCAYIIIPVHPISFHSSPRLLKTSILCICLTFPDPDMAVSQVMGVPPVIHLYIVYRCLYEIMHHASIASYWGTHLRIYNISGHEIYETEYLPRIHP